MTFFKFLSLKLKNAGSNYWTILTLRIFVRLLGVLTAFYWLNLLSENVKWTTMHWYQILATSYYVLFFVFLDWYTKVSLKDGFQAKALQWLNFLKWIPLMFSAVLVYLSTQLYAFPNPEEEVSNTIIRAYMKVLPEILVPNLSFIIITILIFYAAALLRHNSLLKQENDLTI